MFLHSRWICCLVAGLLASPVQAQSPTRSPEAIGAIIDAVLHVVVPRKKTVERQPAVEIAGTDLIGRAIRLDYAQMMAAFGMPTNATVRAKLGLGRAVTEGSAALLDDCDQLGGGPCRKLGRSVYVRMKPLSISDSAAVVLVEVVWATAYPSKPTLMSAFTTQVFLTRSGSGPWRFLKLGRGVIS